MTQVISTQKLRTKSQAHHRKQILIKKRSPFGDRLLGRSLRNRDPTAIAIWGCLMSNAIIESLVLKHYAYDLVAYRVFKL